MSVVSSQSVTVDFTTSNPSTGAAQNADSLPAGTLVKNGTDNGATVTVTNNGTGYYKAAVTLPTLSIQDIVQIRIAATVNSVAGVGIVWTDTCDLALSSGDVTLASSQTFTNTSSASQTGDSYAIVNNGTYGNNALLTAINAVAASVWAVATRTLTAISSGIISGNVAANVAQINGQTANASASVTFPASIASPTNITSATGITLASSQTFTNTSSANQTGDSYAVVTNGTYGLNALLTAINGVAAAVWGVATRTLTAFGFTANANVTQVAGQTANAAGAVTFPGTIASPTNITSASGITLAASQTFTNTSSANQTGDSYGVVTNGTYGLSALQTILAKFQFDGSNYVKANAEVLTGTATLAASQTFTNTNSANQTGDSYPVVSNGTYGNSALNTAIGAVPGNVWTNGGRTLTAFAFTPTLASTQNFNNTGTWTGSLTGSVGSVTGAVGSVSGVTFNSSVPNLSQITGALPTDTSIQSDVRTGLGTGTTLTSLATASALSSVASQLTSLIAATPQLGVNGTVNDSSPTAGSFHTTISSAVAGTNFAQNFIVFTTSSTITVGQGFEISAYTYSSGLLAVTGLPAAPSNGDSFVILGRVGS